MKRKALRIRLAEIIDDVLGLEHYALTLHNVKRHIDRSVLRHFQIRDNTAVYQSDWIVALQIVREDRRNHFYRLSHNDQTPRRDRFLSISRKVSLSESERSPKVNPKKRSQYV